MSTLSPSSSLSYQQVGGNRQHPYERGAVWYCFDTDEMIFWSGARSGFLADATSYKWVHRLAVATVAARMLTYFGEEPNSATPEPGQVAPLVLQVLELVRDYGFAIVGAQQERLDEARLQQIIDSVAECSNCQAA